MQQNTRYIVTLSFNGNLWNTDSYQVWDIDLHCQAYLDSQDECIEWCRQMGKTFVVCGKVEQDLEREVG